VLPSDCDAHLARGAWDEPRIFSTIQSFGEIADDEMEHVFNLGLGMLVILSPEDGHRALDTLRAGGHQAWRVGEITEGDGRVVIAHDRR
jgi:phosphoribosylformylglycinamidine cyclo-ligase